MALSLTCPASPITVNAFYSSAFVASGGTGPYTYAIIAGSLPPGLTLDPATGKVQGQATSAGLFGFTCTATDSLSDTISQSCALQVNSPTGIKALIFVRLITNPATNNVFLIPYDSGVWGAAIRISPDDDGDYGIWSNVNGGGVVVDPLGFTHLFYGKATNGRAANSVFTWYHVAVDATGPIGATQVLAGITNNKTMLTMAPTIVNNEILVPCVDNNGQPGIFRAQAKQTVPTWTFESVSSDVIPFVTPNGCCPVVAGEPNGTLHYFYPFADFVSICQIRECVNTGSGWSAPTAFVDDSINPVPNDPGPGNQELYFLGAFWMNGGISLASTVLSTLLHASDVAAVRTPNVPIGTLTESGWEATGVKGAAPATFAPIVFNGRWNFISMTDSNPGLPPPGDTASLWQSADGGNTWTLASQLYPVPNFVGTSSGCAFYSGSGRYAYVIGHWRFVDFHNVPALTLARVDLQTGQFDILDNTGPAGLVNEGEWDVIQLATASSQAQSPSELTLCFKGQKVYAQG